MRTHFTRRQLLATTIISGALLAMAAPAVAQDAAPAQEDETTEVEEIVVTGSRIRRSATTAPTPLIQVTREDIDRSGEANVIDFLADVPALQFSQVPEDTTGANLNDGGLSLLNLRNLGAARTLTLVDGRRHVGSQPNTLAVDIDTIPRLLIESVEIITGGAASVYGADAVSGVANFILKDDYEGLEVDSAWAQINQDGQSSERLSALWGRNFFHDTLNVYLTGEYKTNDEVQDKDVDWRREGWTLITNDVDPNSAPGDGVIDRILINNAHTFIRGTDRGGITILATTTQPSPAADPDLAFSTCPTAAPGANWSGNCFFIAPPNRLTNSFLYSDTGQTMPLQFGSIRAVNGNVSNGGNGQLLNTQQGGNSRLPDSREWRVQTGFTWDVTDRVTLFGEAKYAEDETFDSGQRTFYDFNIYQTQVGRINPITSGGALGIGLDNAYLPADVRLAIQNNVRTVYNAAGAITGTVADPRAQHKLYPTDRTQTNSRDLQRYVLGMRGEAGDLGFVRNVNWEIGYTFGEMNNRNVEVADGRLEVQSAADAVVDTAGIVNGRPGEIVCRVRLLKAQGHPRPAAALGTYEYTDEIIDQCVPMRIFGPGGISDAARDYIGASLVKTDQNRQQDFLAFASGNLWDFWGAGQIGFAVGVESRKESTSGNGRDDNGAVNRLLFLNSGPGFPAVSYETREAFVELRLPLLKDSWLGRSAEISGSYRTSDYSSIGLQDTYSIQGSWRPVDDLLLRATQNTSIRVPDLGELNGPQTQTFANGFTDPCIITVINAVADPTTQANQRANCQALSRAAGFNFSFNTTTAADAYLPAYGTGGIPGLQGGNPFLQAETSDSLTVSMVWTPRMFPNFSMVLDYYDIVIDDAIATTTAQQNANQCVSGATINAAACATLTRDPNTWLVTTFVQGSLNYAKLTAEGVDFATKFHFELEDVFGHDWGRIDWNTRGTYNIQRQDFTNIANPAVHLDREGLYQDPTASFLYNDSVVRFLSTVAWSPTDRLSVSWDWDWQSSQEIEDVDVLVANPDRYDSIKYLETGAFSQHDFTVRYQIHDDLTVNAGVINAFDEEPARWLGNTTADNFDLFGRRFFVNMNYKVW